MASVFTGLVERRIYVKIRNFSPEKKRYLASTFLGLQKDTAKKIVDAAWKTVHSQYHSLPTKVPRGFRTSTLHGVTKYFGSSVQKDIDYVAIKGELLLAYRFVVYLVALILKYRVPKDVIHITEETKPKRRRHRSFITEDDILTFGNLRSDLSGLNKAEKQKQTRKERTHTRTQLTALHYIEKPKKRIPRVTWMVTIQDIKDPNLRSKIYRIQQEYEATHQGSGTKAVGRIQYGKLIQINHRIMSLKREIQKLQNQRAILSSPQALTSNMEKVERRKAAIKTLEALLRKTATQVRFSA